MVIFKYYQIEPRQKSTKIYKSGNAVALIIKMEDGLYGQRF